MRTHHLGALLALTLLPAALTAQTNYYYSPDNNPATGGANVIPFGSGTSSSWTKQRCQFLFKSSFLSGKPGLLRSIAFTPSGSGTITYKAFIITIGHNNTGTLGPTFAGSFIPQLPKATVINQANFSWTVTADTWNRIPLAGKPFLYNGKDNLVVDVMALGSNNPSAGGFRRGTEPRYYTTGSTTSYSGAMTPYGKGCQGSNSKTPAFANYGFPMLGVDEFELGVKDGPASGSALLVIGNSNTVFATLKLPLDLSLFGATGCSLLAKINLLIPQTLDAAGVGRSVFPFPKDNALLGLNIYSQWLLLDPPANPAGLITSEGMTATVGAIQPSSGSGPSAAALKMEIGMF